MKYDDAEYYSLNFTNPDTPWERGGRVIAMYFAWALSRGLGSSDMAEAAADVAGGKAPVEVLFDCGDGVLLDEFLNDEGNAFTSAYYEADYYADFESVFDGDYAETAHPLDDALSIPDTPENLSRLSARLDQRFREWKSGRLMPTAEEVLDVAEAAFAPLLAERGFGPATERDWAEARDLRDRGRQRYWACDFDGGREWLLASIVEGPRGQGLYIGLSSRIDSLAREVAAVNLEPYFYRDAPSADRQLPMTAFARLKGWWPWKNLQDDENAGPSLPVSRRTDLTHLPRHLETVIRDHAFPLLDRMRRVETLKDLFQFGKGLDGAKLRQGPFDLVPMMAVLMAGDPALPRRCDEWGIFIQAHRLPGQFEKGLKEYARQLLERHAASAVKTPGFGPGTAFPQGRVREWAGDQPGMSAPLPEPASRETDPPVSFFGRLIRAISMLLRL